MPHKSIKRKSQKNVKKSMKRSIKRSYKKNVKKSMKRSYKKNLKNSMKRSIKRSSRIMRLPQAYPTHMLRREINPYRYDDEKKLENIYEKCPIYDTITRIERHFNGVKGTAFLINYNLDNSIFDKKFQTRKKCRQQEGIPINYFLIGDQQGPHFTIPEYRCNDDVKSGQHFTDPILPIKYNECESFLLRINKSIEEQTLKITAGSGFADNICRLYVNNAKSCLDLFKILKMILKEKTNSSRYLNEVITNIEEGKQNFVLEFNRLKFNNNYNGLINVLNIYSILEKMSDTQIRLLINPSSSIPRTISNKNKISDEKKYSDIEEKKQKEIHQPKTKKLSKSDIKQKKMRKKILLLEKKKKELGYK